MQNIESTKRNCFIRIIESTIIHYAEMNGYKSCNNYINRSK